MSKQPNISIIILNHNGGAVTNRCLSSIIAAGFGNAEILLVDNNSSKKEVDDLKKKYQESVRFICLDTNCGYARGNNIGAKNANGKFLIFLNNDTVVTKNWLTIPIETLKNNPKIAFLQPKIVWSKHPNFFEYSGGAGGFIDYFGYPFVRGRIFGSIEEDIGQYEDAREVFWASGVAMFCHRQIFEKLAGFDEIFFTYAEEDDLCFRAHRAGYKIMYIPKVRVYHQGAYTSNRNVSRKIFFHHRNHLFLLIKNLQWRQLLFILPVRVLFDCGSMIFYILRYHSLESALAVVTAYFSFLFHVPQILVTRKNDPFKHFGYPKKTTGVFRGSIVFEHFFRKKKKWSQVYTSSLSSSRVRQLF